jgi:MerR family redox-sensitive transcriptional activator SoxR
MATDDEALLTIGEVAARAGVATSAVRYRDATLRRLVFIGMLQDAGLSLDDIEVILGASTVDEWKAVARERLVALDAEIARLQRARLYLDGALLCRFDHPVTECRVMGAEIDRRLAVS